MNKNIPRMVGVVLLLGLVIVLSTFLFSRSSFAAVCAETFEGGVVSLKAVEQDGVFWLYCINDQNQWQLIARAER